jgi:hypothetical protein
MYGKAKLQVPTLKAKVKSGLNEPNVQLKNTSQILKKLKKKSTSLWSEYLSLLSTFIMKERQIGEFRDII